MLGSTSPCYRVLFALLGTLVVSFVLSDWLLYMRVQEYAVRPVEGEKAYSSSLPCDLDPLCIVTVKGLLLDHPNHYLLGPLAAIVDRLLSISSGWTWVSPNAISGSHVLVAIAAAKCVASDSLSQRRIGVLLFQVRTWMDDLDGHVARKRRNIDGERSDFGSTGYFVDGICDGLGCAALMVGVYLFLRHNPPRRGYEKLQQTLPSIDGRDCAGPGQVYRRKSTKVNVLHTVLIVVGHLIIASIGWNRYISLYQDLLESDEVVPPMIANDLYLRQSNVLRSGSFWSVVLSWRLFNFHAAIDYLLLAIFLDRLWEYMKIVQWLGYVVLLILIYFSELHFLEAYAYVHGAMFSIFLSRSIPPYGAAFNGT
ncbi:ceramide phosphoethanolamine synthase [Orussus abietinus]|uniref:ceramide phosphoethanolamine synthase n=1 Tax=Orussus abietinus TaxID=222816 RepID=UPI00062606A9|nr:ceramide phosphoethanolamine synthase [Orussus abietinus]